MLLAYKNSNDVLLAYKRVFVLMIPLKSLPLIAYHVIVVMSLTLYWRIFQLKV